MWRACWVRLFLTPTKRLKIHAASPLSLSLFGLPAVTIRWPHFPLRICLPSRRRAPFIPTVIPFVAPPPIPSSPPSVHLSTLIPLPLSLFLQHLHHFVSLSLFPPPPFLVLFATPLFGPDAELTAAEFAQTCWTPRNREGKPAWSFFCGQNRNSGIIFFQSEIKQRSSYKHAADQQENKYSPECVSIVYRALFHSVLWWKSGASAVCRCRKRHFTPLHTHVATHVHAEGVTAVLRCTVTAAVEGKREGKTRGGVFSDLLLLGKEWCHVLSCRSDSSQIAWTDKNNNYPKVCWCGFDEDGEITRRVTFVCGDSRSVRCVSSGNLS